MNLIISLQQSVVLHGADKQALHKLTAGRHDSTFLAKRDDTQYHKSKNKNIFFKAV